MMIFFYRMTIFLGIFHIPPNFLLGILNLIINATLICLLILWSFLWSSHLVRARGFSFFVLLNFVKSEPFELQLVKIKCSVKNLIFND